jgi:hypothetical protein
MICGTKMTSPTLAVTIPPSYRCRSCAWTGACAEPGRWQAASDSAISRSARIARSKVKEYLDRAHSNRAYAERPWRIVQGSSGIDRHRSPEHRRCGIGNEQPDHRSNQKRGSRNPYRAEGPRAATIPFAIIAVAPVLASAVASGKVPATSTTVPPVDDAIDLFEFDATASDQSQGREQYGGRIPPMSSLPRCAGRLSRIPKSACPRPRVSARRHVSRRDTAGTFFPKISSFLLKHQNCVNIDVWPPFFIDSKKSELGSIKAKHRCRGWRS